MEIKCFANKTKCFEGGKGNYIYDWSPWIIIPIARIFPAYPCFIFTLYFIPFHPSSLSQRAHGRFWVGCNGKCLAGQMHGVLLRQAALREPSIHLSAPSLPSAAALILFSIDETFNRNSCVTVGFTRNSYWNFRQYSETFSGKFLSHFQTSLLHLQFT